MREFKVGDPVMVVASGATSTTAKDRPGVVGVFDGHDGEVAPYCWVEFPGEGRLSVWPEEIVAMPTAAELSSLRSVAEQAVAWRRFYFPRGDEGHQPSAGQCTALKFATLAHEALLAKAEPAPKCADCGEALPAAGSGVINIRHADGSVERVRGACLTKRDAAEAERQAPKCADCGEAIAREGAYAFMGEVALRCSRCHAAEKEKRAEAERLRAHAARVKAAIEEHKSEGVEFQYGKGGMWFGGDRAPFEPESVGWVRWTDAAGDVHTIEFQGAGNG